MSTFFLLFQVMLSGHIPPGIYAQAKGVSWYYPIFNVRFLNLLQNYSDVITSTIFGHEHTDGFRIVYSKQGHHISYGICSCRNYVATKYKSAMYLSCHHQPFIMILLLFNGLSSFQQYIYSYQRITHIITNDWWRQGFYTAKKKHLKEHATIVLIMR